MSVKLLKWRFQLKEILLVGNIEKEDTAVNNLIKESNYKIVKVNNANKAIRVLKHNSPDFVLCTGRIRQNSEGHYFLEL